MSSSAAASTEEFIEVLNAEQHVEIQKLRDYARHGVQAAVRGEVWLYLLGVLSDDKSQEMTSVRSKYMEYDSLDKHNHLYEKRIRNEAVRYYQRKLIPRPLPGRTLARSSHRIASSQNRKMVNGSSYATNETTIALTAPSVAIPALNTIVTTSATTRGPNRVHDGKTQILAGIMGDSSDGKVGDNSVNNLTGDESDVLIDPEAAAANEMKRFCRAVENIVCAYLNRWKWRSVDGTVTVIEPDKTTEDDSGDHSIGSNSSINHEDQFHTPDMQHTSQQDHRSISSGSSGYPKPNSNFLSLPENGTRGRASTISSSSSTSSFDDHKEVTNDTIQESAFPSLPREYEWAHQGNRDSLKIPAIIGSSGQSSSDSNARFSSQGCFVQTDYHPDLILLCSPFVKCVRSEPGMFFAFEKLMSIIGELIRKSESDFWLDD